MSVHHVSIVIFHYPLIMQIFYSNSQPYTLGSEASLADLNSRLVKQVTFAQFRPNLIVSTLDGIAAYEEVGIKN